MTTADWLLIAVLANVLAIAGVLAYAFLVKRESWLSPIVIFLGFLELFTLPLPMRALQTLEIEGDVTEQLPQLFPYLAPSVWLVTLGVLVFVACYYLPQTRRYAERLPELALKPGVSIYAVIVAIGGVALFLIALLARDAGGILPFVLLGYGGAAEMFGRGYLAVGFPWLFIASLFLLVRYAVHRQRRDVVLYGVSFVVLSSMNAVMGNRNAILYQLVATVLFWHFGVARIRIVRALPLMLAAFMALNLLGFLRGAKFEDVGDVFTQTSDRLGRVQEADDLHRGMFYTLTTGEFVVPFETLPMLMRADELTAPTRWGSTFVNAFGFFVPQALWPDRPESLGAWYMKAFYGGGFLANEGRAFFFLSEGYLNFGPVGVLLVMAVWGIALGTLAARLRGPVDPAFALIVAVSLAYIYRAISGEFVTMLVGLPQQSLLPIFVAYAYLARITRRVPTGAGSGPTAVPIRHALDA